MFGWHWQANSYLWRALSVPREICHFPPWQSALSITRTQSPGTGDPSPFAALLCKQMCARSPAPKVTAAFWQRTTAAAHLQRGKRLSAKTRGGSHPPPACKASSAFVPLQMTPRWVDLIIHTCMPIHNASKIPGLWQHLTWTAYQQALGRRPRRIRRENPHSRALLI